MATLRNDNGALRIQAAGGYNNSQGITMLGTSMYIGINKSTPTKEVDVTGNCAINGNAVFSTINYTGSIIYNGSPLSITSQWTNTAGVVNYTGSVGIGVTTPGSNALAVSGTMSISVSTTVNATVTTTDTTDTTIECNTLTTQGATFTCGALRTNELSSSGAITLNTSPNNGVITAGNVIVNTINGNTNFIQSPSSATWTLGSGFIGWGSVYLTTGIWRLLQADQSNGFINTFMIQYAMWGFYGSYLAQSNIATWASLSDRRIKHDIIPITEGLNRALAIEPVEYTLRKDPAQETHVGFIAQDVQPIFPLAVDGTEQKDTLLSLSAITLMPYYVSAFQELQTIIDQQEKELVIMEAEEEEYRKQWALLQEETRQLRQLF